MSLGAQFKKVLKIQRKSRNLWVGMKRKLMKTMEIIENLNPLILVIVQEFKVKTALTSKIKDFMNILSSIQTIIALITVSFQCSNKLKFMGIIVKDLCIGS